jgi:hypothetical protein
MTASGRRLSIRNRLVRPVEAVLVLCRNDHVPGWIVDEQDEGIGMAFGGADVGRMRGHASCCLRQPVDLWIGDEDDPENRPVPMRLVHVTPSSAATCVTGLTFDVRRMKSKDIVHLLGVWRSFVVAARVKHHASPAEGPDSNDSFETP